MDSMIVAMVIISIAMVVAGIAIVVFTIAGRLTGRWAVLIGCGLLFIGLLLGSLLLRLRLGPVSESPAHDILAASDVILATMPLANIAFNVPASLHVGHSTVIQLFLSLQHSIEQLQAKIGAIGERIGTQIQMSPQMEARLSGVGFKIEAVTSEVQLVSEREITEWKWEIEPTQAGRQYLHLTLSAILHVGSEGGRRTVRTFERIIEVSEVTVPWPQRVAHFGKDNWQWLWAAILLPVIGWIIGLVRKRRKEKTTDWGGSL